MVRKSYRYPAVAKKKQRDLWQEPLKKYDFYGEDKDFLIRDGEKHPDIYIYAEWRKSLILELGNLNLLAGKALEEYNTYMEGGSDNDAD